MNSAIIVAGGMGSRFGTQIPKQFHKINNKKVITYAVDAFLSHPSIEEVIIVSHPDWILSVKELYPKCKIVSGGKDRRDSSLNGILAVNELTENILIHDAVRPFVSHEIISLCIKQLSKYNATAPIANVTNSLIKLKNNKASYIDRSTICEVQTPQCFKKEIIMKTLLSKISGTDEIGMVLRKFPNIKIKFIKGDKKNIKITNKLDLKMAIHIASDL